MGFKFKKNNQDGTEDKNYSNCKDMKFNLFKKGYVTQSDINYFSLKLLNKFPFISKNISYKFPIFLIDEAQDTNEIQMNILKIILNQPNISDFIFIGDFNQAIFEWNGANPEQFKELMKKHDVIKLNENWRSSQEICNFSFKLSNNSSPSSSVSKFKEFDYTPEIISYDNLDAIITYFLNVCKENDIVINEDNVAVLTRGNSLLYEILGKKKFYNKNIWIKNNFTKELIYSKVLHEKYNINESYNQLKYILISLK